MTERIFAFDDQRRFAKLSGDTNPLHLDPIWAASSYPGAVVVHGMHALLWGLEAEWPGKPLDSISATFIKPILLGDRVSTRLNDSTLTLLVLDQPMLIAQLGFAQPTSSSVKTAVNTVAPSDQDEYVGRRGTINVPPANRELPETFPVLAKALGEERLRGLTALSYLVGMECPGRQGMFAGFSVSFGGMSPAINYLVTKHDPRFGQIAIAVEGCGLIGTVAALVARVEPSQPSDEKLSALVERAAFADQQPLVVGGSNGLGAITAMLLAIGGARPVLTYRHSARAANDLASRIKSRGGACDLIQLDVGDPSNGLQRLKELGWHGGEVYYFATPRIFRRRLEAFQEEDLRQFLEVYVDGFYKLVRGLMDERGEAPLCVFYPSSVAVDTRPTELFEYALAKDAGERLCRQLEQRYKSLSVIIERLPRIATRQTHSFLQVPGLASEEIMAPLVRRIQQRS